VAILFYILGSLKNCKIKTKSQNKKNLKRNFKNPLKLNFYQITSSTLALLKAVAGG